MNAISTEHDTVVVKRTYAASPDRVFAAWSDPNALVRWYTPGDDSWTAQIVAHDFGVGGVKQIAFGPAVRLNIKRTAGTRTSWLIAACATR